MDSQAQILILIFSYLSEQHMFFLEYQPVNNQSIFDVRLYQEIIVVFE